MSDKAGRLRKNRETTGSAALLRRARAASGDASVSEGRRQEGRSAAKEAHGDALITRLILARAGDEGLGAAASGSRPQGAAMRCIGGCLCVLLQLPKYSWMQAKGVLAGSGSALRLGLIPPSSAAASAGTQALLAARALLREHSHDLREPLMLAAQTALALRHALEAHGDSIGFVVCPSADVAASRVEDSGVAAPLAIGLAGVSETKLLSSGVVRAVAPPGVWTALDGLTAKARGVAALAWWVARAAGWRYKGLRSELAAFTTARGLQFGQLPSNLEREAETARRERWNKDATAIQTAWRRAAASRRYRDIKAASAKIGRVARGHLGRKESKAMMQAKLAAEEEERAKRAEAALTIGRVARGHLGRKESKAMMQAKLAAEEEERAKRDEAALAIGRVARGHLGRKESKAIMQAKLAAEEEERAKRDEAALAIGRVARGHLGRKESKAMMQAKLAAEEEERAKRAEAALAIGRVARGHLGRKESKAMMQAKLAAEEEERAKRAEAALAIGRVARGHLGRKESKAMMQAKLAAEEEERAKRAEAALAIGRVARGHLGRKESKAMMQAKLAAEEEERAKRDEAALAIGRVARGHLGRKESKAMMQAKLAAEEEERAKRDEAALAIGRVARGHLGRKESKAMMQAKLAAEEEERAKLAEAENSASHTTAHTQKTGASQQASLSFIAHFFVTVRASPSGGAQGRLLWKAGPVLLADAELGRCPSAAVIADHRHGGQGAARQPAGVDEALRQAVERYRSRMAVFSGGALAPKSKEEARTDRSAPASDMHVDAIPVKLGTSLAPLVAAVDREASAAEVDEASLESSLAAAKAAGVPPSHPTMVRGEERLASLRGPLAAVDREASAAEVDEASLESSLAAAKAAGVPPSHPTMVRGEERLASLRGPLAAVDREASAAEVDEASLESSLAAAKAAGVPPSHPTMVRGEERLASLRGPLAAVDREASAAEVDEASLESSLAAAKAAGVPPSHPTMVDEASLESSLAAAKAAGVPPSHPTMVRGEERLASLRGPLAAVDREASAAEVDEASLESSLAAAKAAGVPPSHPTMVRGEERLASLRGPLAAVDREASAAEVDEASLESSLAAAKAAGVPPSHPTMVRGEERLASLRGPLAAVDREASAAEVDEASLESSLAAAKAAGVPPSHPTMVRGEERLASLRASSVSQRQQSGAGDQAGAVSTGLELDGDAAKEAEDQLAEELAAAAPLVAISAEALGGMKKARRLSVSARTRLAAKVEAIRAAGTASSPRGQRMMTDLSAADRRRAITLLEALTPAEIKEATGAKSASDKTEAGRALVVSAAAVCALLRVPEPSWKVARRVVRADGFTMTAASLRRSQLTHKSGAIAAEVLRQHDSTVAPLLELAATEERLLNSDGTRLDEGGAVGRVTRALVQWAAVMCGAAMTPAHAEAIVADAPVSSAVAAAPAESAGAEVEAESTGPELDGDAAKEAEDQLAEELAAAAPLVAISQGRSAA
ncbi:hypothetical protein FNF28_05503 [Cafeteria roenbergensis]|uniref:Uncharacterized protein n=1 Tax=Cafeteria roenbergensis TaxID=33653 RepID=A0A5A8D6Q5_CAFRO|nr:hypothetical protein FNF28_05503 [Cafeteria roenbergensis]